VTADARWWHDSRAAYEIRLTMGTAICDIDRVSRAALVEKNESALAWCEAAGWDLVLRENL
jgi:hypothetical protein